MFSYISYITLISPRIAIEDGLVLSGSLLSSKMKLVQAWIEIHKEDLMVNWKLAVTGEPIFKIDPLK